MPRATITMFRAALSVGAVLTLAQLSHPSALLRQRLRGVSRRCNVRSCFYNHQALIVGPGNRPSNAVWPWSLKAGLRLDLSQAAATNDAAAEIPPRSRRTSRDLLPVNSGG